MFFQLAVFAATYAPGQVCSDRDRPKVDASEAELGDQGADLGLRSHLRNTSMTCSISYRGRPARPAFMICSINRSGALSGPLGYHGHDELVHLYRHLARSGKHRPIDVLKIDAASRSLAYDLRGAGCDHVLQGHETTTLNEQQIEIDVGRGLALGPPWPGLHRAPCRPAGFLLRRVRPINASASVQSGLIRRSDGG